MPLRVCSAAMAVFGIWIHCLRADGVFSNAAHIRPVMRNSSKAPIYRRSNNITFVPTALITKVEFVLIINQ